MLWHAIAAKYDGISEFVRNCLLTHIANGLARSTLDCDAIQRVLYAAPSAFSDLRFC